jgi:hypothetical protein
VSAGVATFEALRQLDAGKHAVMPRQSPSLEEVSAAASQQKQKMGLHKTEAARAAKAG